MVDRPSSAGAYSRGGAGTGAGRSAAGRIRSTSPCQYRGGSLASDMRRIASLLDPAPQPGANNSINMSLCSSPQSAWEPCDRGATPTKALAAQQQVTLLEERLNASVNASVQGLQRQGEADRRRLGQLERKLEARLEAFSREDEGREKWAEIRGSVNGLIEEVQALTKRVEGLDERLWARTGGAEMAKQRNRELETTVQALEQQVRLNSATMDEASKRQAAKMRRIEHALEESTRRMAKVEEEARARLQQGPQRDEYAEVRISALEQQQEQVDCDLNKLQMQIDELAQGAGAARGEEDAGGEPAPTAEDAMLAAEKGLNSLRKDVMSQVQELESTVAGLRVKADGQLQRVTALGDRLEKAHEPAMEAFRAELAQLRQQDRREVEAELSGLKGRVQQAAESSEEAVAEVREALRQTAAEIAAISLRPEENSVLRNFDERLTVQEQEQCDLRSRLEALPPPAAGLEITAPRPEEEGGAPEEDDLEDIRRRLEWLEEQSSAGAAAERAEQKHAHDTVCELVESVSRLKQQASSAEAASSSVQQQLQQLQGHLDRRLTEESGATRLPSESEARVKEMWEKVAELHARLLEVEGGLDFARESSAAPLCEVSAVSEAASGANENRRALPPLPRGAEPEKPAGGEAPATPVHERAGVDMREKLEAVAEHLEVVDELLDRVAELEKRSAQAGVAAAGAPATSPTRASEAMEELLDRVAELERRSGEPPAASPAKASEVSFGGDAPIKGQATEQEVSQLRADMSRLERIPQDIEELKTTISKLEAVTEKEISMSTSLQDGQKNAETQKEFDGLRAELAAQERRSSLELSALKADVRSQEDRSEKELSSLREELSKQEQRSERELSSLREEVSKQESLSHKLEAVAKEQNLAQEALAEQVAGMRQQVQQAPLSKLDLGAVRPQSGDVLAPLPKMSPREETPRMSPREASSVASRDGCDLQEIIRTQFEALSEQMAGKLGDLDTIKGTVEDLEEAVKENKAGVEDTRKAAEQAATELRQELHQLRDQLKEDLGSDGVRAMELDKIRLEVVKLATDMRETREGLDAMKDHDAALKDLRQQVGALDVGKGGAGGGLTDGVAERLKTVEERLASGISGGALPDGLAERLQALEEQVAKGAGGGAGEAKDEEVRLEVQQSVEQLKAKLESELGNLDEHQKGLAATRTALEELAERVQGQPPPTDGTGKAGAGGEDLSGIWDKLKALEDGMVGEKDLSGIREELKALRDGMVAEKDLSGIRDQLKSLEDGRDGLVTEKDLSVMKGRLKELADDMASEKDLSQVRVQLKALEEGMAAEKEKLERLSGSLPRAGEGSGGAAEGASEEQLRGFERRLAALESGGAAAKGGGGGEARPPAAEGEEEARREAQEQVASLQAQISKELADLAKHQQELGATRLDLQALAEAKGRPEASGPGAELGKELAELRAQVEAACSRLGAAEDASSAMRRDLEQLQGPRKVGISLGGECSSPLADVAEMRQRLGALTDQVAELQQSRAGGGRHARSVGATPEASLNFSLTEQSERNAGESLNFSLTQSQKELSLSEPVASAFATPARRRGGGASSAAAAAEAAADAAEAAGSAGGSPVSVASDTSLATGGSASAQSPQGEGKDAGDIARGQDRRSPGGGQRGDALDSVLAASASICRNRPRPSPLRIDGGEAALAPVAEEEPGDVAEGSPEVPSSTRQQAVPSRTPQRTRASPITGAAADFSPSPGGGSVGSLDNSRSGLEVSASCNEVSVGVDYSVEDSTELDKCDHIETVSPNLLEKVRGSSPAGLSRSGGSAASSPAGLGRSPGSVGKDQRSPPSAGPSPAGSSGALARGGGAADQRSPPSGGPSPAGSGAGQARGGGAADTLDALLSKPAPAAADALDAMMAKPAPAAADGKPSPAASDALDDLVAKPRANSGPSPRSPTGKAEEEYGEESFEEEIEESVEDGSGGSGASNGSGAWGEDEDV